MVKLQNPITVGYLKKNLRKTSPRLVLTPAIEKQLQRKVKTDPVVSNMYKAMQLNAVTIQAQPLLERKLEGRRLLGVSREMLYRMNILCMVYRIDKSPELLKRIDEELKAVCRFQDWNPSHYLDVAEMSLAVALSVDWVGAYLPSTTVELAKTCLIEKGIKPSFVEGNSGWVKGTNNWNQVCHGGMIAAALVIADKDPELATRTISRALDGMPYALAAYAPDGVYPEGSTYWSYGTSFTLMTCSMFQSAFGTDFGLSTYPSLLESADFKILSVAPSGWYFNFADCGDKRSEQGDIDLAWFAVKTGNPIYFEADRFLKSPEQTGRLDRNSGVGLVWLSQYKQGEEKKLPLAWKGLGENPIVIFRGDDSRQFYFGGKGGHGSVNHGNMDAGSFIFELDGVRWVVDPGNQDYNQLEQAGFDLWGRCQTCQRWTLLTKNNFGHSTLTINNELHNVDGFASLIDFKDGEQPEATFDLTEVFKGKLKSATRTFRKESNHSLLIADKLQMNDSTESITWQLMTTANVILSENGAVLQQGDKTLTLQILSPDLKVSVISLDPPPLQLDRRIEGLKRIEIRIPPYLFPTGSGSVSVRLTTGD
ncbi:MAG TPA: heparinase II/III family protein [Cyclobacteriaceae bacterium]|nr:heparinase II/III family protein [Cyclobacteriaceae bacterium]